MSLDMPVENLGQGRRRVWRRLRLFRSERALFGRWKDRGCRLGVCECVGQIAQRFGLSQQALGQSRRKCPFDAQQKFGARQAVEAPVAVERAVEPGALHRPAAWLEFMGEIAGNFQDR